MTPTGDIIAPTVAIEVKIADVMKKVGYAVKLADYYFVKWNWFNFVNIRMRTCLYVDIAHLKHKIRLNKNEIKLNNIMHCAIFICSLLYWH